MLEDVSHRLPRGPYYWHVFTVKLCTTMTSTKQTRRYNGPFRTASDIMTFLPGAARHGVVGPTSPRNSRICGRRDVQLDPGCDVLACLARGPGYRGKETALVSTANLKAHPCTNSCKPRHPGGMDTSNCQGSVVCDSQRFADLQLGSFRRR